MGVKILPTLRDKKEKHESRELKLVCHKVRDESLKISTRRKIKYFLGSNGQITNQGGVGKPETRNYLLSRYFL